MTGMTQTEYAAHRGVSRQAISKLVKAGKIPPSAFVDGKIDPAAADFALGENRERIFAADVDEGDEFGGADPTFGSAAGTRSVSSDSGVARLTQVRTAEVLYKARFAELAYDKEVGKLLETKDVTRAMERCAAVIVRELEGLPNFADDIAAAIAKDGLPGARQALKNIARNVRLALEQNMRVVAAEDDETGKEGATS